jgi:hypothetical protein
MATPRTCSAGSKRGDRGGDCAVGFQIEANPIDDDAELLVTGGDASELYVLLWNRRDAAGSEMGRRTKPGFGSFAGVASTRCYPPGWQGWRRALMSSQVSPSLARKQFRRPEALSGDQFDAADQ